jgi:serine/threonine protein kinase
VLLARIEARLRALGPRRPPTQPPLPPKEESEAEATASRAPTEEELHKDAVAAGLFGRFLAPLGRLKKKLPEPIALGPTSKIAGRYVIQAPLGKGQFGKVYRARHLDLDEPVALKVLTATGSPRAIEIFRSEAQSACRAKHPNAVRVLDFGLLPPESAFLVMELLEGPSLQTVLDLKGRFELEQALTATRAVLSALAMAHKQGLVHRDVKPSNVVLHEEDSRQVPKLIDFGLARGEELWGDAEGGVAGSPAYLAPERIRGLAYDGRADVYACGVMLWKLLTGELPMAELVNDVDALARWHLDATPPKPSTKVPTLSPAVDAFVLKLLTKDPAKRPPADEAGSLAETALWS